ncbi:electron transport complex subunit RsxB [Pseudomonas sp. NFR16]|uniref:electron transport complex subunit RsxB n=1 Tax=Pseudomonas sp. NFR16 TaxID=1566248 RepID=UPI0008CCA418|nr:electron transport complex subunit RsxB [Pseudomonas sp. NFR16]SEJ08846.1 electron transport complex protein RnfB [Pseudomonas sp. NFR16]
MNLIQRIDALLPQTQCGKCGHPGCKPYAEGIANGEAINKCPPGGDETIAAVARLLNVPIIALDNDRGSAPAQVAFIREAQCIGCTKCIQACPVDAIVGAAKLMHTVIVDECTGCDLCVAPCPVDCIELHPLPVASVVPIVGGLASDEAQRIARAAKRGHARQRFEARNARLEREERQRQAERLARQQRPPAASLTPADPVQAALERVRLQRAADNDAALKQARTQVSMSRAQLHKSLKAFGHPPTAEQAARLVELGREFEEAQRGLAKLLENARSAPTPAPTSSPVPAKGDAAGMNRAKIQLAMRRAALNKAIAAQDSAERIAALGNEVNQAAEHLAAFDLATGKPD